MAEAPLTGSCLCGRVRFAIDEPLLHAGWCHCSRCRRRTGCPASVQGRVVPGSLRLLGGAEHVRVYRPADGFGKAFCSECGAQLWSCDLTGEVRGVRLGVICGDPGVRPSYHQFVADAAVWQPLPDDGLPRYPQARPA
jgi:hypothetical protein